MRFNSLVYFAFLATVVVITWALPARARKTWLLLTSYVFYASWHWPFLALLIGAGGFNSLAGHWIAATKDRSRRARWVLAANLLVLAAFKYLDWLVGNANAVTSLFGPSWQIPLPGWVLPLGVSFYIFECASYVIDLERKRERTYGFWDFQLYLAFFPHLIAGPIMRAKEFFPQLAKEWRFDAERASRGLMDIAVGLFLKVVLADGIAPNVDAAFARSASSLAATDAWIMAMAFGLQIYFDFAGYSRIAIGSGRLCGIELVDNFDHPYLAKSPTEFWARWHMSLSRWIRDYLFFPLAGTKPTLATLSRAALLSMTLCGLWHGAAWTFVLWGTFHGLLIVGYHVLRERKLTRDGAIWGAVGTGITFGLVSLGWLLFRSQSVAEAFRLIFHALMPWRYPHRALPGTFYLHTVVLVAAVFLFPTLQRWWSARFRLGEKLGGRRLLGATASGVGIGVLFVVVLLYLRGQTAFIYFQF